MMIYIINDHVRFDSSSGSLFSPEHSPDSIQLSRAGNGILTLFIENPNVLLSREYLLTKVWENQGLDSSSNNLNNTISILRKALLVCGCSDIIKTMPRQGFIFTPERITIAESINSEKEGLSEVQIPSKDTPEKADKKKKTAFGQFLIFSSFILLCFLIISIPNIYDSIRLSMMRTEVFRVDSCRIYVTDENTAPMTRESMIAQIKDFLKNKDVNCTVNTNIYFSHDKAKDAAGKESVSRLFSYCFYNSTTQCVNYQDYIK